MNGKFADLRLICGFMFQPLGTKLLFMAGELSPSREWNHDCKPPLYRGERWLYEADFDACGFEWVDCTDFERQENQEFEGYAAFRL